MKPAGRRSVARRRSVTALLFGLLMATPGFAQEPRWYQAETWHFLFIYEQKDRPAVDELLTFCEPVYDDVTGFFQSYPPKVPVIVHGRVDEANGLTTSFPQRIELYLPAPADDFIGSRTENWLRLLLTHELTHFVHFSMDKGLFSVLSRAFGSDVATIGNLFLPGWMIEGPSTNLETIFTLGGRGRNPLFELYWKAPVEEGKLFSLEQAGYDSAYDPPGRIYVGGYLLVNHLLTTYGRDTFTRIMDEYLKFPFFGPWAAIRKITGKSAAQVFDDLRDELARRYAPDAAIRGGEQITPRRLGSWQHPVPTARGLYLYRAGPFDDPSIVRLDPATGSQTVVVRTDITDPFSFTSTADGEHLYLAALKVSDLRPADAEAVSDLYRYDVGAARLSRLTRNAHLRSPAVSPDGRALVAVQMVGAYARLVSVDVATGELRLLYSMEGGNLLSPAFSPDGARLAFAVEARGFQDVYVADLARLMADSQPLPTDAVVEDHALSLASAVVGPDADGDYYPWFLSPTQLLFSSDRGGSMALYRADLETGAVAKVQEDPVAAVAGAGDGTWLLYQSYTSQGWCVKRISMADLVETPLAPVPAQAYPPPMLVTGASIPASPYVDLPRPLAWYPDAAPIQTGPSAADLAVGLGVSAIGGSYLGLSSWTASVNWEPDFSSISGAFSLTTTVGPLGLTFGINPALALTAAPWVSLTNSIVATAPIIVASGLGASDTLSLSAGFYQYASSSAPYAAWSAQYTGFAGVATSWQRTGPRIDLNPTLGFTANLQDNVIFPITAVSEDDVLATIGVNLPSPVPHESLKLGIKAVYTFGGPFSSYSDSVTLPRGFTDVDTRTVPGTALASVDYQIPIALLDQPLLAGWAITTLGMALHAEARADFGAASFSVDRDVYLGGDLTAELVCGYIDLPLGIGLAARVDRISPSSFSPANDLRPYVFLGFDSFSAFAQHGVSARVQAAPSR